MKKKLIFWVFAFIFFKSHCQSVTGTSGLIHIPTARMLNDGEIVLGISYIPTGYFTGTGGIYRNKKQNPGLYSYVTYGILPFVEIMFRYSHEINAKVNPETRYFPDRMFSIRINLLEENKNRPSLIFGLHDFGRILGDFSNGYFTASYLAVSKEISVNNLIFDLTIGKGFKFYSLKPKEFDGIFYGLKIKSKQINKLSLLIENNVEGINSGLMMEVSTKLKFMIGLWDLKKITFSTNITL